MSKYLTIPVIFFLFSSCSPYVYTPNTVNVPLFNKKNQTSIAGYWGTPGLELQGAYSFSNHFQVVAGGKYLKRKIEYFSTSENNALFGEIGLGYFYPFNENIILEFSGGGGLGSAQGIYSEGCLWGCGDKFINVGKFSKYFAQSAIGYTSEQVEAGACVRYSLVIFPEFEGGHYSSPKLYTNQQGYFLEPALFLRLGGKRLKFSGQFGLSVNNNSNPFYPEYVPFFISGGCNIKFGKL